MYCLSLQVWTRGFEKAFSVSFQFVFLSFHIFGEINITIKEGALTCIYMGSISILHSTTITIFKRTLPGGKRSLMEVVFQDDLMGCKAQKKCSVFGCWCVSFALANVTFTPNSNLYNKFTMQCFLDKNIKHWILALFTSKDV